VSQYADLRIETFDGTGPSNCASIDTLVELRASNGTTVLASDDDGGQGNCSLIDSTSASFTGARHLAPGTYYVQVKPYSTATPAYTLLVTYNALCGNGLKEGSEQCDGGFNCAADCTLLPICGDGNVVSNEQCDDGNLTANDGCSPTCTVEPGYQCSTTAPSVCTKQEGNCNNGLDDDGDGLTDAADPDCALPAYFIPCSAGQTLQIYRAVTVPGTIADADPNGAVSPITASLGGTIARAAVLLDITHTYDGDVDISFISPNATVFDVSSDNGSSNDHYTSTLFDTTCATAVTSGSAPYTGCFKPEASFATLNGTQANGIWKLKAVDDAAGIAGTLNSWSLILCTN
jgi:cysteine-rich repeat protein